MSSGLSLIAEKSVTLVRSLPAALVESVAAKLQSATLKIGELCASGFC